MAVKVKVNEFKINPMYEKLLLDLSQHYEKIPLLNNTAVSLLQEYLEQRAIQKVLNLPYSERNVVGKLKISRSWKGSILDDPEY